MSAGASTVELTADGSATGKCAMPSAETLAGFDTAFEGATGDRLPGLPRLYEVYLKADPRVTTKVTVPIQAVGSGDVLLVVE